MGTISDFAVFLQSSLRPVSQQFLCSLVSIPPELFLFLGVVAVVDQLGIDLVVDDPADEVVADAFLEGHPLLLVVVLQYFGVLVVDLLVVVLGADVELPGAEVDL